MDGLADARMSASAAFSGHRRGSSGYRRMIIALFAAGVATFSQLYSFQGVLPQISQEQNVSEASAALTVSLATLGLAVAVLPWSIVADRRGRRATMRVAIVAAVALGLLVPWSPSFEVLLGLRFLEGLALGGIPAVALTYLADEVEAAVASVAAGTYIAGTTLGGLFGRMLAGPLGEIFGWRAGSFSVALSAAVAGLVFFLTAPEPRGFEPVQRKSARDIRLITKLGWGLKNPHLLALFVQSGLLMGGFVAVYNYMGFRLEAPPYLVPTSLASLVFLTYLAGTYTSAWAGRLASRKGRFVVLVGAALVMFTGLLITLIPWIPGIIVGLAIFTGGFFGAHAVASSWVPAIATRGRAQASSLYNLVYYTGSSLFGWAVGFAFQAANWGGVVIFVGVLICVAVFAAVKLLPRDLPPRDGATVA